MKISKIKTFIEKATDEDVLQAFIEFLKERVSLGNQFVTNDEGIATHQIMYGMCGDSYFSSEPQPLQWPMKAMEAEALVGKENIN